MKKDLNIVSIIEVQTPGISEPAVPFDSSQVKYVLSEIKSKTRKNNVDTIKKNNR
jgi:hypothetical protein